MKVKIAELTKDGLQTRVALDERTVSEYADAMREGAEFPPVMVFSKDGKMWLADGFHRVEAATRAGQSHIEATVTSGAFIDALRYALKCNTKHGKRVTNEDKQNAMRMAWENREELFGGEPSGGLLAETCGISPRTAATFLQGKHKNEERQPMQIAYVDKPTASAPVMPVAPVRPTRKVVGLDGKKREYPAMPTRPTKPTKPAHVVPLDRYVVEIPPKINDAFDLTIINFILRDISSARVALRKNLECGNIGLAAVRQDALIELNNAYNYVDAGKPWCVCRICQGNGCMACHERGWQTEDEYNRNPIEFKSEK